METTRQLYQLQELDIAIEEAERTLAVKTGQLGNRGTLNAIENRLAEGKKALDEAKRQRREAEQQVEDALVKIKAAEQQLYSGKVTNPKELSNLQSDIKSLKGRNDTFQDKALGSIEIVEAAEKSVAAATSESKSAGENWESEQKVLAVDVKKLQAEVSELKQQRAELAEQIEQPALVLYQRIKTQKKTAVAKVERGICRACRISLSANAVQRARSGHPVQCGTCGRILFIS
jgi:uncharacterized protein